MAEEDYVPSMFPDLWDNSNDDQLSVELGHYCFWHLKDVDIQNSQNDFLILLALFWCQINLSFMTKSRVVLSLLCLHFWHV